MWVAESEGLKLGWVESMTKTIIHEQLVMDTLSARFDGSNLKC